MTATAEHCADKSAWSRRQVLRAAGSAGIAPGLSSAGHGVQEPRALVLARELGLTGMGARELIRQVGDAVGPQRMAQQRLALLHRMDACHYATAELVDMLRMWGREDFAQDRTTTVGGLRFADTEIALFALVAHA